MKIINSKEAAMNSSHWSNPGARLYNAICDSEAALKEAYLSIDNIGKDVSYTKSGCKFPHHSINKNGDLVLNVAGVKAAYSRAKQMGVFKGEIKDHLVRHYKELGIYNDSTMVSDEKMNENFNKIESFLGLNVYTESFMDEYVGETVVSHNAKGLLKEMEQIEYYSPDDWRLQSPVTTYNTKKGNCHDQSLLEYTLMKNNGIDCGQIFFIEVKKETNVGGMTHTLTWYIDNKKYYWFEHAWETQKGIHGPYDTLEELKQDVYKAWEHDRDGEYDTILFSSVSNYIVGMDLDQYVASWELEDPDDDTDKRITESMEWIHNAVNGVFTEKSHGSLKYCYRIGFDVNTGEQVAVEFELDPEKIVPPSKDFQNTVMGQSYRGAASDKLISAKLKKGLDAIKKNIRKTGYIDFISDDIPVHVIFTRDSHKSMDSVKMVPFFGNAVFDIVGDLLDNIITSEENKTMTKDEIIDKVIRSKEFKSRIQSIKHSSGIVEYYKVGRKCGKNKYMTTKLIWQNALFSSNALSPALRGKIKYGAIMPDGKTFNNDNVDKLSKIYQLKNGFVKPKDFKEYVVESARNIYDITPLNMPFFSNTPSCLNLINEECSIEEIYDVFSEEYANTCNFWHDCATGSKSSATPLPFAFEGLRESIDTMGSIIEIMNCSYMEKSDIDNNIEKKFFITSDDGVDNCCVMVKGYDKPMRARSSMITLKKKDDKWYILTKDIKGVWCMPGGGWNKNEDPKDAAIRELHEETRFNVKNVERHGLLIEYREAKSKVADWVKEHIPDENDWWYGYYSAIFVGIYNGDFKGTVDEHDWEDGFKWEEIDKLKSELRKEYRDAIDEYLNEYFSESVFTEASHGKLKYDFRYAYDINTGHRLKIIYSLDDINVSYAGHAYDQQETGKSLSTDSNTNKEVGKNISKKGNMDHKSSGQKVLAIIDEVTNIKLKEANTISFMASGDKNDPNLGGLQISKDEILKRLGTPYANISEIKVGEIDTKSSFKSTKLFSGSNAIKKAQDAEMVFTTGRGVKPNDLVNVLNINDKKYPVYRNPSKKEGKELLIQFMIIQLQNLNNKDFIEFVRQWNSENFVNSDLWKSTKGMKVDPNIINSMIKILTANKDGVNVKKLAECKKELISERIVESVDDDLICGVSIGDNIIPYINRLKSDIFTNEYYKENNDTLIRNILYECGFPAHTIEILESLDIDCIKESDNRYLFYATSSYINLLEFGILTNDIGSKISKFEESLNDIDEFIMNPKFSLFLPKGYVVECMCLRRNNDPIIINFNESVFTEADDNDNPPEIENNNQQEENTEEENNNEETPLEDMSDEELLGEPIDDEPEQEESHEEEPKEEPKKEEPKKPLSMPKQTDEAEKDKNGVRRKKLYIAFIEWCKAYNSKNTFGSVFDKDIFHNVYPFVPHDMRYFYRLANPILCVLSGDLTFFQVSELRNLNKNNKKLEEMMIFAATEEDLRVFNNKDKKVYRATENNGEIELGPVLGATFDLYIQNMIDQGDILNGPIENEVKEEEE